MIREKCDRQNFEMFSFGFLNSEMTRYIKCYKLNSHTDILKGVALAM